MATGFTSWKHSRVSPAGKFDRCFHSGSTRHIHILVRHPFPRYLPQFSFPEVKADGTVSRKIRERLRRFLGPCRDSGPHLSPLFTLSLSSVSLSLSLSLTHPLHIRAAILAGISGKRPLSSEQELGWFDSRHGPHRIAIQSLDSLSEGRTAATAEKESHSHQASRHLTSQVPQHG